MQNFEVRVLDGYIQMYLVASISLRNHIVGLPAIIYAKFAVWNHHQQIWTVYV